MTAPTPLLDFFKRGEVAADVRLLAAQGVIAPRTEEQLALLVLLVHDPDPQVRTAAAGTIDRIPARAIAGILARPDVAPDVRAFFAERGLLADESKASEADDPLIDGDRDDDEDPSDQQTPETIAQRLAKMGFSERLKAAIKGSREMRAILIRDPNKMIAAAVLSSPKVTEQEVEGYARMSNVSEDVLRIIGATRSWTRNYSIVVGLTRNPKTPLALSLNLINRLTDRDLQTLSVDRNIPEPLRVAARRRVLQDISRR